MATLIFTWFGPYTRPDRNQKPHMQLATPDTNTTRSIQQLNAALESDNAGLVILCDASGSMTALVSKEPRKTRTDVLRETLLALAGTAAAADGFKVYTFAGTVAPLATYDPHALEGYSLEGGTDIGKALRRARRHNPAHIILITDGSDTENSTEELTQLARSIFAKIDTYFCGDHSNATAIATCRELAQYGGNCIVDPGGSHMLESMKLFLE